MSNVVLSSSQADAQATEAVEQHHAELAGALALRVEAVVTAAAGGSDATAAVQDLVSWLREELLPHARAEEDSLYPAAATLSEGRLLVASMMDEHRTITELVTRIETAPDPVRAAAHAVAVRVMFESHLTKENEQILPLLAWAPGISVAELLDGMHEILGGHDDAADDHHADGHHCGCGEVDGDEYPELDARTVPHAIRHATIFGALDGVKPGGGMVLVAPHDPLPLLAQIEERSPGAFSVSYLERGPEAWRLQFERRTA